jgi:hypothetical protein
MPRGMQYYRLFYDSHMPSKIARVTVRELLCHREERGGLTSAARHMLGLPTLVAANSQLSPAGVREIQRLGPGNLLITRQEPHRTGNS